AARRRAGRRGMPQQAYAGAAVLRRRCHLPVAAEQEPQRLHAGWSAAPRAHRSLEGWGSLSFAVLRAARVNDVQRLSINPPPTQAMYDNYHFSQATRVGNTIWVSGQVGIDAHMRPAVGAEAQARLAFQSLQSVLEAAGANMADIVELMTFHIDLRGDAEAFGR